MCNSGNFMYHRNGFFLTIYNKSYFLVHPQQLLQLYFCIPFCEYPFFNSINIYYRQWTSKTFMGMAYQAWLHNFFNSKVWKTRGVYSCDNSFNIFFLSMSIFKCSRNFWELQGNKVKKFVILVPILVCLLLLILCILW